MSEETKASNVIDTTTYIQVLEAFLNKLREHYVFPEVAEQIASSLQQRSANAEYDSVEDGKAFTQLLTAHAREISRDKHLRVFYREEVIPPYVGEAQGDDAWAAEGAAFNYGFYKVERLAGNIGYLDFREFYPTSVAGDVGVAAMNFLAGTSAMIVDLRKNNGGEPSMIALLCSYFFPPEPVHLNSMYWRNNDSTQQFWTLPYVPGKRFLDKPVYVLTSHETFSGAEEFTYNLKNLKRAIIIGETTGGGAHPGDIYRLHDHFETFIPTGRAINPISGTNWEGTGVTPDIETSAEQALERAHSTALKKVLEGLDKPANAVEKALKKEIQETLAILEA